MPVETVDLMVGADVRSVKLYFVDRYGHGVEGRSTGLAYLHRVRQLVNFDLSIQESSYYSFVLPEASKRLVNTLEGQCFDAILRPPSSRDDALPYLQAIADALDVRDDWTPHFRRINGVRSGLSRSCDAVFDGLELTPPESLGSARSVLMVDDSFTDGSTACAILRHLLREGLSSSCEFAVAAPLRIVPTPSA